MALEPVGEAAVAGGLDAGVVAAELLELEPHAVRERTVRMDTEAAARRREVNRFTGAP